MRLAYVDTWAQGGQDLTSECLFSCAESLHLAMFCDKKSKMHRSATEFTGWDVLGWEAKLDAAKMVLERRYEDRSLSSRRNSFMGKAVEKYPSVLAHCAKSFSAA